MKFFLYGDRTPPLGRLERDMLELIWRDGESTASALCSMLAARRTITLSTVQTTLERLTRKRLLARTKNGRGYRYRAIISRDDLLARMMADLADALSPAGSGVPLAALLDFTAEVDAATLDRLERWIEERRRRGGSR
jgi:predicted transcriptional regulator